MRSRRIFVLLGASVAGLFLTSARSASAQETPPRASSASSQAANQGPANAAEPRRLTLQDALALARKNSTQFQAAQTDAAISRQDRYQAATALLPGVTYNTQALYSQSNGPGNPVRFIANNAVHEYISQANIHETIDLAGISSLRRASAVAALARARAEIASRGLVVAVVPGYYSLAAAQQKLQAAQKASEEGNRFFKLTQDLPGGGEVAPSRVVKAELQMNDRRRQLQEAQLTFLNARLDLAVLLFSHVNQEHQATDALHSPSHPPPST